MSAARVIAGLNVPTRNAATAVAPIFDTGGKKAKLLFIDDEERILTALRSVFCNQYNVFTASSGSEAMEFMKRLNPHVVISDQRMPEMTGVEFLRQL